jgi:hypothetical protein
MNNIMHHSISDHVADQMIRTHNSLGIKKIDRIYDKNRNQLILMVNTHEMLDRELNTFLKHNNLILEAPIQMDYNRPFRTHLAGDDLRPDGGIDISLIGFAEIKLKPGYHYTVMSCQLINPTLVKIILNSRISFTANNHSKH